MSPEVTLPPGSVREAVHTSACCRREAEAISLVRTLARDNAHRDPCIKRRFARQRGRSHVAIGETGNVGEGAKSGVQAIGVVGTAGSCRDFSRRGHGCGSHERV